MRWTKKPPIKAGDRRTKTRFLFCPKTILDQTRWLELASWQEEVVIKKRYGRIGIYYDKIWLANFWID